MKTFNTVIDALDYSVMNPSETVECKSYFSNGQLCKHSFYVAGELNGEYKTYHYDGKLGYHGFYVNGNMHGEYKSYYSCGSPSNHCFFVAGELNGESKSYYSNGQLRSHCFYVAGEEIDVDYLRDGSYKSLCILITLFDGNIIDEDI